MFASLLIVDDFPETLATLGELYSMDGRDVRKATSGTEAIALMKERPSSIIWIDEDLYDFRGTELAFHLKAIADNRHNGHPCITIAVSGAFYPGEIVELPGFDHLMSKPVDFQRFDALLARYDDRLSAPS